MYLKVILFFVIFKHLTFSENENQTFLSEESRLFYNLFTKSRYDTNVRPVKEPSKAVVVEFLLSLITIEDLDLKNEVLVMNVWQTMRWKDEFLKWNPGEYGGIKKIQVSSERLWLPDIKLANEVQDHETAQNIVKTKSVVSYDGTILNVPSLQLRSKCPLNVRYFPFDTQICSLKFMPWSHTGNQLDLSLFNNNTKGVDLNDYSMSAVYRIFRLIAEKHEVEYKISENESEKYVDIMIHIGLVRKPLHHIYSLILPSVIISILVLLVFRLSADSGEKIALGVTLLLVFHVMLWGLSEKLPETNHIPLFAIYLSIIMIMTGLSVILSVSVLNLHGKGHENQVPTWMRELFLEKLATVLCMGHKIKANDVERNQIEISDIMTTKNDETHKETTTEKLLQLMLLKQELETKKTETANEWRAVALIVDRLFFLCFSIITVVISVYMLLVIPLTNRTPTDENLKEFEYL